ncbi:MAG: putative AAA+ superfamily ATPase, partial [Roseivirga sp.]
MLNRSISAELRELLNSFPAVALMGPRQVGKTTLANEPFLTKESIYLDLESPRDLAKLSEPELYLKQHRDKLVILDEVHRLPNIFQVLRGIIDQNRREGIVAGSFLLLGSASIDLLRQSGESLAGRIAYVNLDPLNLIEVGNANLNKLWFRGGFPDSFLAKLDLKSNQWRANFIKTYLERDIPQFGPRIPA